MLNGEGTNNSTTITDTSPSAHSMTANGNTHIDTAQAFLGSSSIYVGATQADYVNTPDSSDWDFGRVPSRGWWESVVA